MNIKRSNTTGKEQIEKKNIFSSTLRNIKNIIRNLLVSVHSLNTGLSWVSFDWATAMIFFFFFFCARQTINFAKFCSYNNAVWCSQQGKRMFDAKMLPLLNYSDIKFIHHLNYWRKISNTEIEITLFFKLRPLKLSCGTFISNASVQNTTLYNTHRKPYFCHNQTRSSEFDPLTPRRTQVSPFTKISILFEEGIIKISYVRRAYESVDEQSPS